MTSRPFLFATLAAASAAAVLWSLRPASESLATMVPAPAAPAAPAATTATTAAAIPRPAPAADGVPPGRTAVADSVPPGLTAAQWARVEAELARHPQPEAERARLRSYFVWSDAVQRWRGARDDAALAREIDAGLPARLANTEVSVAEARLLKAALLQVLVSDAAQRQAALQAFDATLPQPAGPSAQERQYQQRQSALVAAWQAQPASQRDPAALQRQIDALRRAHFQKDQKETTR